MRIKRPKRRNFQSWLFSPMMLGRKLFRRCAGSGKLILREARTVAHDRKGDPLPPVKPGISSTSGRGSAFQHYQAALQLLQQGKADKALAAFEKLLPAAPAELQERCKMYISTCERQLKKHDLAFLTPEEHYDYAVSQLNTGYYEEAREQFNAILTAYPEADYAFYGLAVLEAITGQTQECLRDLARAIELNPRNRLQARVDNDFQSLADDPRFTELLYPEVH
ncbi:MAG: tetratricopeptide repeat protein [Terracidiphilus sp.]